MVLVRVVFKAKPGKAGKLAKLFKTVMGGKENVRVMTDAIADFNTVVVETEYENLADYEEYMLDYESGKLLEELDPDIAEDMKNYTDLYVTGKREVYRVVE